MSLAVRPWPIRLRSALRPTDRFHAKRRVRFDVSLLYAEAEDDRKNCFDVVPELSTVRLPSFIADAGNERRIELYEGSFGDWFQVIEHPLVVGLCAVGELQKDVVTAVVA